MPLLPVHMAGSRQAGHWVGRLNSAPLPSDVTMQGTALYKLPSVTWSPGHLKLLKSPIAVSLKSTKYYNSI